MIINRLEIPKIVHAYVVEMVPMIRLGIRYGVSRSAIYRVLSEAGVDTSKKSAVIDLRCDCCGKKIRKIRSIVRRFKNGYCGQVCYFNHKIQLGREASLAKIVSKSKENEVTHTQQ